MHTAKMERVESLKCQWNFNLFFQIEYSFLTFYAERGKGKLKKIEK